MTLANLRGQRLRLVLAATAGFAFILQGYDQALMNGLLSLPAFTEIFPSIDTSTPAEKARNSRIQGTAVAIYEVGAALGALLCFFVGNHFGRKKTVLGASVVILIGVAIQASSYSLGQLIAARIITGVGVGAFTATCPTWVAESSEAHERGRLVMLQGSGAIFGVMFCSWLELGLYFVGHNPASWRFPVAFQAFFPIVVLSLVPFLPESPRWLMVKDRYEEGAAVLARLEDEDVQSEAVMLRVQSIRASIEADSQGHSNNPFARTPNRHLNRTLLAVGVNILAQMTGVNIITFYIDGILEGVLGYSGVKTRIIVSCLQTWQWLMATTAVFLVDRFGRRRLLIVCAGLMTVAHAGLAGLQSHKESPTAAGCSLIFYFLALAAFPIGLFLIPFVYASEIAPNRIRSKVAAISTSSNWLFNFLIAEITPVAFANIDWKYYLVYVCTTVLAVVVFYLYAPETKGRTLEDIDTFFTASKNALQPVKVAKNLPENVHPEYDNGEKEAFGAKHEEYEP